MECQYSKKCKDYDKKSYICNETGGFYYGGRKPADCYVSMSESNKPRRFSVKRNPKKLLSKSFVAKQKMRFFVGFSFVGAMMSFVNLILLLKLNYGEITMTTIMLIGSCLFIGIWAIGFGYYRSGMWDAENTVQSNELNSFMREMKEKIDKIAERHG
jgi:hypothetical protein